MYKRTKNVPISQNEAHKFPIIMGAKSPKVLYSVTLYGIEFLCLPFMDGCFMWTCTALYGLVAYVAPYGLIAFHGHGHVWPHSTLHGLVWHSVFLYGLLWPSYGFLSYFMVFYGRKSSFLAVIDQNSFGLVSIKGCFKEIFCLIMCM